MHGSPRLAISFVSSYCLVYYTLLYLFFFSFLINIIIYKFIFNSFLIQFNPSLTVQRAFNKVSVSNTENEKLLLSRELVCI